MDDIAARLHTLREMWGESARALSLELGVNAGAWNVWERGSSLPSADVLTQLAAQRNVNLHWLLAGIGQPLRSGDEEDVKSVLAQLEAQESKQLGISTLAMMASRANVTVKARILEYLFSLAPGSCSLSQLYAKCDEEKAVVLLCLVELLRSGQVETVSVNGVDQYKAAVKSIWNQCNSEADVAAVVLDGIKFLAQDVMSGAIKQPNETLFLSVVAGVPSGRKFLDGLSEYLRSVGDSTDSSEPQMVKLVIAAKIQ